jgi:hypothetical protein
MVDVKDALCMRRCVRACLELDTSVIIDLGKVVFGQSFLQSLFTTRHGSLSCVSTSGSFGVQ